MFVVYRTVICESIIVLTVCEVEDRALYTHSVSKTDDAPVSLITSESQIRAHHGITGV